MNKKLEVRPLRADYFAVSKKKNNPMPEGGIPPLPAYAADLEADHAFGPAKYASAEEGMKAMEARIAGLNGELMSAVLPEVQVDKIMRQIQSATVRLCDYKQQHESRN